jgi:hypothetical protein
MNRARQLPNKPMVSHAVPRFTQPLSRTEIEAVLAALDPATLRSAIVQRVNARAFVTEDVLARIALRLENQGALGGPESQLVVMGGRNAGIGLWLAEATRTNLVVLDPDQPWLDEAMHACGAFELDEFPTFQRATYDNTRLPTASVSAIVSLEAFYLAPYPSDALSEAHRVLANDGVLMFDAYVAEEDPEAKAWVAALAHAGFDVLDIDDQTAAWRAVTREQHLTRLHYEQYLVERLGSRRAGQQVAASRSMLNVLQTTRRVELLARRRRFARSSSRLVMRTPIVSPTVRR